MITNLVVLKFGSLAFRVFQENIRIMIGVTMNASVTMLASPMLGVTTMKSSVLTGLNQISQLVRVMMIVKGGLTRELILKLLVRKRNYLLGLSLFETAKTMVHPYGL
jgi:hypothetical protein